jgi:hypothetical protein
LTLGLTYQFAALQYIADGEKHITDLSYADIAWISQLDHGRGSIRIEELGAECSAECRCVCVTDNARSGRYNHGIGDHVCTSREIDDLSNALEQNSIKVRSIISDSITSDWQISDSLHIYHLVDRKLLVCWRLFDEVVVTIDGQSRSSFCGQESTIFKLLCRIPWGILLDVSNARENAIG